MSALADHPIPVLLPDGVREEVDCPFCGSDSFSPVTGQVPDILDIQLQAPYDTMKFQMVQCSDCSLCYQRLKPTFEDLGMFYDSDYFCYVPMSERGKIVNFLVNFTAKGLLRKLKSYAPRDDCTLLDCTSSDDVRLLGAKTKGDIISVTPC